MPTIGDTSGGLAGRRPYLPGLQSGNYFFPIGAGLISTDTFPAGNLYLTPWLLEQATTIDRIGVDISTAAAAGTLVRPALYADNGTGYPGSLVVDPGTLAADAVAVVSATISQALAPALYWVGFVGQGAAVTARSAYGYEPVVPIAFGTATPDPGATPLAYFQAGVTGALPATFSTTKQSNYRMPRVHMRVA